MGFSREIIELQAIDPDFLQPRIDNKPSSFWRAIDGSHAIREAAA